MLQADMCAVYGISPLEFPRLPYAQTLALHRQIPRVLRRNNLQVADLAATVLNALGVKKTAATGEFVDRSKMWSARDFLRWTPADIDEYLELGEPDTLEFDPRALQHIHASRRAGRITDAAWMRLEPYWIALLHTLKVGGDVNG